MRGQTTAKRYSRFPWTGSRALPGLVWAALFLAGCTPSSERDRGAAEVAERPAAETLPSWNDGASRAAIVDFVRRVTDESDPDFVPEPERVAVFDNDGCLWSERPVYFQLLFAMDRIRALAPDHPEWASEQPFRAVLEGDMDALGDAGEAGLVRLMTASHTGNTTEEFRDIVRTWLDTARHPQLDRPFTELVYLPMLELLDYLRSNGFKTFIVSGGGIEFLRVFAEDVYGIPPEQVVGSSARTAYEVREGVPALVRLPEIDFVNDGPGKPVGINSHIGRRPIMAFGNSDGDFQMLEWTTSGPGPRFGALVHHDDADREWAYDRESHVGHLARGLDEAAARGWILVSMRDDWATIYRP